MPLRNTSTGGFEVDNISNNNITNATALGTVGLNFQVAGFAADPPTAAMGTSDGSTSQLVQAMAGFGSGAADGLNVASLTQDSSQQMLLTTPQHS
jgi:hypothetical protein